MIKNKNNYLFDKYNNIIFILIPSQESSWGKSVQACVCGYQRKHLQSSMNEVKFWKLASLR